MQSSKDQNIIQNVIRIRDRANGKIQRKQGMGENINQSVYNS